MAEEVPDHYATLGLGRRCTLSEIQAAYRAFAARFHPDRNHQSGEAVRKMQELNEAYETLRDPHRRQVYNRGFDERRQRESGRAPRKTAILQDVHVPIRSFFRGATLDIRVNDPSNPAGVESYRFDLPTETAPGAKFRIARTEYPSGGAVQIRVKPLPDYRFKARGSDLRCDLRIAHDRAQKGGIERLSGPADGMVSVNIPPGVSNGEVIRIAGEGLPKSRGGRGDLLVRIRYRPLVRVTRRGG